VHGFLVYFHDQGPRSDAHRLGDGTALHLGHDHAGEAPVPEPTREVRGELLDREAQLIVYRLGGPGGGAEEGAGPFRDRPPLGGCA